jgi:hypothetical protein
VSILIPMKTSKLVKIYAAGASLAIVVFGVLPFMISSGNESICVMGFVLILILGLGATLLINNALK